MIVRDLRLCVFFCLLINWVPLSADEADDRELLLSTTSSLIKAEETILDLSPRHSVLVRWLESGTGSLPSDFQNLEKGLFLRSFSLEEELTPSVLPGLTGIRAARLPLDDTARDLETGINPFHELTPYIQEWALSGIGVVSGRLVDVNRLVLDTKLEGSGRLKSGDRFGVKAYQEIVWKKAKDEWVLSEWNQERVTVMTSPSALFQDVTEEVVPDSTSLWRLQKFEKREMIKDLLKTGEPRLPDPKYRPFINADNSIDYPSVSIVDYNQDGLDDIFLTSDWDATQLLKNLGDGTFEDVTFSTGLSIPYSTNCAVFADFDNDGDQDAFIGRSLEASLYFENRDGFYYDVTKEKSDIGALYFVSALSVTDFNQDGLLDIYASTYGPVMKLKPRWEEVFLPKEEWEILRDKERGEHRWLNLTGHANAFMVNRGNGEFERFGYDDLLSQWRRSFQAAWADYDGDGDDDLYICNDFAPDELLRNDTETGAAMPKFTKVTNSAFANGSLGFGMGASWSDYDHDGDLDLYVSNMYSKAGKRIIEQIGEVDPRVTAAAQGNFLFDWNGKQFDQKAGSGDEELNIHMVGWSYGGQFGDINNDGLQDLYVPSGYYTAPPTHSTQVDT